MTLASAVYGPIRGTAFALVLACAPASAAGAQQIEVDARWAAGTTASREAILILEPDQKVEPPATTIEVRVEVPGRARVSVPRPGVWRARLVCEGYWSEEKKAVVAASTIPVVSLRLFPAARIQGTLASLPASPRPAGVVVDFVETPRYGPLDADPVPEGSAACEVADQQMTCTLPAGHLDLRFHTPGLAPFYVWGVELAAGQPLRIGTVRLAEGGSVVGWIQDEDGQPLKNVKVQLAAAVALELSDPVLSQRIQRQRFEATTNERGFFQVTGVSRGTFRLSAAGEGFSEATPEEIMSVERGNEERLESPIVLRRPVFFEIALEPPLDPLGQPWEVEIFQVGESRYIDTRIQGRATPAGLWRQRGLTSGDYYLHVSDSRGSRWVVDEIRVDARAPLHVIEIPIIEVVGTVTRDGEAVPGVLALTGKKSTVDFEVDESGEFAGFLPDEDRFSVVLTPTELKEHETSLVLEPVELARRKGRKVALDIKVVNTRIEGDVVDSDGRPVRKARVHLRASAARDHGSSTLSDEDGEFVLWGIPPGDVLVGATSGAMESDRVLVHLVEDMVPPRLTLRLLGNMKVSGQVVTPQGPLAGAQVVGWPDMSSSHHVSFTDVGTDVDGIFQLDVPATARWLNLLVRAPGFATRILREPADPEKPIMIVMDRDGGDVVLELPVPSQTASTVNVAERQPMPIFSHGGASIPALVFRMLSPSVRHAHDSLGQLILQNLESGEYSLCVAPEGLATSRQRERAPAAAQCASGFLSPGGVLVLSLSGDARSERSESSSKHVSAGQHP